MVNPGLVGNGQGWHVGLCLIKELEGLSFIFTF